MKNKLLIITILVLIYSLIPQLGGKTYAQGVSVGIYPPIMQMDTTAPTNANADFYLQNQSQESVDFNIIVKPFRPNNNIDGEIELVDNIASFPDPLFVNRVKVLSEGEAIKSLSIGPKQTEKLVLEVTLPPNQIKGDYYFTVLFVSSPKSLIKTNSTLTQTSIGMNVLLTVGPKGKTEGLISKFATPFFVNTGPIAFKVQITNKSGHYIAPTGEIIVKNMLGNEKGKVKLMPVNILSNSSRYIPDLSQADPDSSEYKKIEDIILKQDLPVAVFNQRFLLGIYTATLNIALNENGPSFRKTITFIAFPITYLLSIFIILGIITFIILRVRRKIN